MKKILFVTPGTLPVPSVKGGAVESILDNIIELNEKYKQINITISTVFDEKNKSVKKNLTSFYIVKDSIFCNFFDVIIYYLIKIFKRKKSASYRNILKRFRYLKKTSKFISRNYFDYIVLENHFSEYLIFKNKKNLLKYKNKIIYHAHNVPSVYRMFLKEISYTKYIIGVSNYCCNECKRIFDKENISLKYKTIKNAVNQDKFFPNNKDIDIIKRKYHVPYDKKIVLFTGRMIREKGIIELIKAFVRVDTKCHLLLVGSCFFGQNINNKESKIIKDELKKIKGRYSFTGFINYDEMPDIFRISDIVVIPSIWEEPAGLTVLETIASGKPLITTNSGGIPEYVDDKCAIILNRDNHFVDSLTISINTLSENSHKCQVLANNALKKSERYNLKDYYFNLVSSFEEDKEDTNTN